MRAESLPYGQSSFQNSMYLPMGSMSVGTDGPQAGNRLPYVFRIGEMFHPMFLVIVLPRLSSSHKVSREDPTYCYSGGGSGL